MKPRVSVVLCVHNDRGGLRQTVESVLAQTAGDFELLVVDDASTDRVPALLADYARADARVRVLTNPANLRLTASINRGLAAAEAPWVARIDEGDTWRPGKLRAQLERLDRDPELVLLGTQCTYSDESTGALAPWPRRPPDDAGIRRAFLQGSSPVMTPSIVFRRVPGLRFNEAPGLARGVIDPISDFEYWLRLSFLGRQANLDEPLADFAYGPGSLGITSQRAFVQFELRRRIHARFLEVLRSGDRAAARRCVGEGFPLGSSPPGPAGRRRGASLQLRYAGSYRAQPWRGLLRAAGYALDPEVLAFHAWSKAWLPRSELGTLDWGGWVAVDDVAGAQPSASASE